MKQSSESSMEQTDGIHLDSLDAAIAKIKAAHAEGKMSGFALISVRTVEEDGQKGYAVESVTNCELAAAGAIIEGMKQTYVETLGPLAERYAIARAAEAMQEAGVGPVLVVVPVPAASEGESDKPPESPRQH